LNSQIDKVLERINLEFEFFEQHDLKKAKRKKIAKVNNLYI
jgi:hypothetical protein